MYNKVNITSNLHFSTQLFIIYRFFFSVTVIGSYDSWLCGEKTRKLRRFDYCYELPNFANNVQ